MTPSWLATCASTPAARYASSRSTCSPAARPKTAARGSTSVEGLGAFAARGVAIVADRASVERLGAWQVAQPLGRATLFVLRGPLRAPVTTPPAPSLPSVRSAPGERDAANTRSMTEARSRSQRCARSSGCVAPRTCLDIAAPGSDHPTMHRWTSASRSGVVALLLGGLLAALRVAPIADPDYFWHLHTGRWIVEHRAIPWSTPSRTPRGAALALRRLALRRGDVPRAVVARAHGARGHHLAAREPRRCRRASPRGAHTARGARRVESRRRRSRGRGVLVSHHPRPQTLTLPLLAIELSLLDRARRDPRWLFAVPPLLALWQNVHSSALLGWLTLAAFAVGESLEARTRSHGASTGSLCCSARWRCCARCTPSRGSSEGFATSATRASPPSCPSGAPSGT